MASDTLDLLVIGAGPGGYVAAIRAAQLGMTVACVESRPTLGGTCLNVGCIPSKALLEASEVYHQAAHGLAAFGISTDGVKLDLGGMMARKDQVVSQNTRGIEMLFKKYGVRWVQGRGRILDPGLVQVTSAEGEVSQLQTQRILIATGSKVVELPGVAMDGIRIVSSTEAIAFSQVPEHLVVIGAGVIGVELGSVWSRLGAKVTVVEYANKILGNVDSEIAKLAQRTLTKQGLNFVLGAKVTGADVQDGQVVVRYEDAQGPQSLTADKVLVSVGRKPNTEGLGLEDVGVEMDPKGRIVTTPHWETNVPGIFAIGDVVAGAMLAHKASEEGVACVERMKGIAAHVNYLAIPDVIYTWPEIASVGHTEDDLKARGTAYKKGTFPFTANSRARAIGMTDGLVKILADAKTDRILGAQIMGARAGEMIHEFVVAIEAGLSSEDIARTCHAHPTLAEAIKEAALAVTGSPIHL